MRLHSSGTHYVLLYPGKENKTYTTPRESVSSSRLQHKLQSNLSKSWPEHYACGFKDIWFLLAKTDNSFTSFLEKLLEILKKNPGCRCFLFSLLTGYEILETCTEHNQDLSAAPQ